MKRYFTFLLIAFTIWSMHAQKHEVGVFVGSTNAITDIGRTDYINPLPKDWTVGVPTIPINLGVLYKFNLNPHQTLRLNLNYTRFTDNDRLAAEDYRYNRYPKTAIKYSQTIYESTLLFEYNFFPINSEQFRAHSPYIFAGVGAFGYNHQKYKVVNAIDENATNGFTPIISKDQELTFAFNVPFGLGYKYKFGYNFQAGIELGVRATFTDDIDMADAQIEDFNFRNEGGLSAIVSQDIIDESNDRLVAQRRIGDATNNDWYVVTGVTLTYIFGRPPCFCD